MMNIDPKMVADAARMLRALAAVTVRTSDGRSDEQMSKAYDMAHGLECWIESEREAESRRNYGEPSAPASKTYVVEVTTKDPDIEHRWLRQWMRSDGAAIVVEALEDGQFGSRVKRILKDIEP